MLKAQALLRRLRWRPQAKCTKNIISFINIKKRTDKLRKLKSKYPKQFWKLLKAFEKDISINDFYTFFMDINSPNNSPYPNIENLNYLIENDNDILNCHISENEILKCIKNFKKAIKHVLMLVI